MSVMKRIITFCLVLMLIINVYPLQYIKAQEIDIEIMINNKRISWTVQPYQKNGTTLVPLSSIFDNIEGATYDFYNGSRQKIKIMYNNNYVILTNGSDIAVINGVKKKMPVPAKKEIEEMMFPAKMVLESLGLNVKWHQETTTLIIETKDFQGESDPYATSYGFLTQYILTYEFKEGDKSKTYTIKYPILSDENEVVKKMHSANIGKDSYQTTAIYYIKEKGEWFVGFCGRSEGLIYINFDEDETVDDTKKENLLKEFKQAYDEHYEKGKVDHVDLNGDGVMSDGEKAIAGAFILNDKYKLKGCLNFTELDMSHIL